MIFFQTLSLETEHDARLILFEEEKGNLFKKLKNTQDGVQGLDARCQPLENAINALKTDMTSMEREILKAEKSIHDLKTFKETSNQTSRHLSERVTVIEKDERVDRLEELVPRIDNFEKKAFADHASHAQQIDLLNTRVKFFAALRSKVVLLGSRNDGTIDNGSSQSDNVDFSNGKNRGEITTSERNVFRNFEIDGRERTSFGLRG